MRATILTLLLLANLSAQTKPAETPQRTIRDTAPFKATPARTAAPVPAANTLDSLNSSTEDLNAIRDANLRRITKDGCAPEISARIAELKGKLLVYSQPVEQDKPTTRSGANNSASSIAADWFKTSPAAPLAPSSRARDLLDAVLPSTAKTAGQKAAGQDVAALKAELEHLSAACPGTKP